MSSKVTWKGLPILKAHTPSSGVKIHSREFEWRSVSKEYGYTYQRFLELSVEEQAALIAHSRISDKITAVLNYDALMISKRKH